MIATDSVTANSRNRRDYAAHQQDGRNTAISETLIETTVKPTSLAPRRAACMRGIPSSTYSGICFPARQSRHQQRSQVARVIAMSNRLSKVVSKQVDDGEGSGDGYRHGDGGDQRPRGRSTGTEHHARLQDRRRSAMSFIVSCRLERIVTEQSHRGQEVYVLWHGRQQLQGSPPSPPSTASMMLAPGWRKTTPRKATLISLRNSGVTNVFDRSRTSATSDSRTAALLR